MIANRIRDVEDRPEWENSSTIGETHDGNSDSRPVAEASEEDVGDLIEL